MRFYNNYIKPLFFIRRFYWSLVVVVALFLVSYTLPFLFSIGQLAFLFLVAIVLLDYAILFLNRKGVDATRELTERFSNGDENKVQLVLKSHYHFRVHLKIIDEIPIQFQRRDFILATSLAGGEQQRLVYQLRPVERGEYVFHDTNLFIKKSPQPDSAPHQN